MPKKINLRSILAQTVRLLIYMLPGIILIILCVVSGEDVPIFASKEVASSIIAISGILIPFSAVLYSSMLRLIELPWGVLISLIDTQEKSGQTVIRKLRGTLELLAKRTTVDIEETTWSSWLFSTGFLLASVFLAFIGLISLGLNQRAANAFSGLAFTFMWIALVSMMMDVYDCRSAYKRFKEALDDTVKKVVSGVAKDLAKN